MCPSPNSFEWFQKFCEAFPKCVFGETQLQLIEIFLRYFQILSKPKVSGILLIFRGDVFELSPSPNSFALYQKCCKAFSKCVLRKIQWHPIEIILRYFQVVSQPNFGWILLKLLLDVFELSPSPNSFAWYQKFCEALPKCVLGEFQLHPIEYIARHFQIVFQRNWIAFYWNCSKTFQNVT